MSIVDRNDALRELLPWYENGTLEGVQHDAVRALLANDLEANRQARELRVLRAAVADEPILASNMATNLRRLYDRLDPPAPRRPRWIVPVSMAAAALLLVGGGFGLFLAGERAGQFHTLTAPAQLPAVPADAVLYRVDVAQGLGADALLALTGVPGARVLQGPSERGVALLAVPRADAKLAADHLRADARLRFIAEVPR